MPFLSVNPSLSSIGPIGLEGGGGGGRERDRGLSNFCINIIIYSLHFIYYYNFTAATMPCTVQLMSYIP